MKLGNYSLTIPQGSEQSSGHVAIPHNTVYTIDLHNHSHRPCDATVKVDGDVAGVYRLEPGQHWAVEHPEKDQGRFTFLRSSSADAKSSGVDVVAKNDRGLVEVTFTPGDYPKPVRRNLDTFRCLPARGDGGLESFQMKSCSSLGEGITGLTGHSNAQYGEAQRINLDPSNAVTITLRLGEAKGAAAATPAARPLPGRNAPISTPVPAPVGGGRRRSGR